MSIHRGMAVVAIMVFALTAAGCDGKTDPTPTDPTSTATSVPTVTATADPAGDAIPLEGDADLSIRWALDAGVSPSDPVVAVGRRTLALVYLATYSAAWRDDAALRPVSDALTTGDDVLLEPTRTARAVDPPPAAQGPVEIVVQPPLIDGETATWFACVDARGVGGSARTSRTDLGVLTSVSLRVVDGTWRATGYQLRPDRPTGDESAPPERYFQRCEQTQ